MTDPVRGHKLAVARLWAAAQQPYLASALFAMRPSIDPGIDTVAVDRSWNLHADPALLDALGVEDLGALLLHLVGHLVRDHADRAAEMGTEIDDRREWWNRCADAEINDDLWAIGILPGVAPDLPADLGAYPHGLAEHSYALEPVGPRRWDCGSGCDDGDRPWDRDGNGLGRQERELLRIDVAASVQRADAQDPGTVPGGWRRWAEARLPSGVDWRRTLAATIRRELASVSGQVDYTYRRPARRAHPDVVLPALHRPTPDVAVVCDTSGSMHDELLARALTEIEAILTRAGLRRGSVRVLAVDATVHTVRRASRASQVELVGGGGTDMGAGIEAAVELRPRPSVVVVVTDGFTPWPAARPKGTTVVVALLEQPGWPAPPRPPTWTRTVTVTAPGAPYRG